MSKANRRRSETGAHAGGARAAASRRGPRWRSWTSGSRPSSRPWRARRRDAGSPAVRLERALEILFDAYAGGDPGFSALLLEGWVRAQRDKQYRLRLAWQREQLRLLLQDILAEGAVRGLFRSGLDAGAVAAVIVGAAEGCLLQAAMQGGAVSPAELSRALVALTLRGA